LSTDNGTSTSYYIFNAHGDVTGLTNGAQTVTKSYDYDAFGNEKEPSATDTNPFRYCGEYFDKETGTYYLRARYYDPSIGRFTQQDTHWNTANMIYGDTINQTDSLGLTNYTYRPNISAVMQSGNLYVYGINNPISFLDINGKSITLATFAINFGINLAVNVTSNLISSYATGGEYGWIDFGIDAATAFVGAFGPVGQAISSGISALYTGVNSYQSGSTVGEAIINAGIDVVASFTSIGNISSGVSKIASKNAVSNGMDIYEGITELLVGVSFGTGQSCVVSAVTTQTSNSTTNNDIVQAANSCASSSSGFKPGGKNNINTQMYLLM